MKLRLETDGDRYPKDVYILDGDERIATMEGHNETTMRHKAIAICRAVNSHVELERSLREMVDAAKEWGYGNTGSVQEARAVLAALEKLTP